ncbi:hypothetical protein [Myxococcus sp. RHSTA-1-4]|uniref:hypothetical protein n=1 Tax=Myxococcus sp. RHSTA-1-4 TaxID=2874601 RepID=UPI001CBE2378|nr:hypothetical protein [Myxococcus sp. RHSTA-1-4]MBZ4417835.1 hypothetical protein [Myxococcus sp. RHSTA-1-4]
MSEGARVGRTVIGKLRLHGAELEPLSARLRLESLLSGAHLVPLGLPPSATVCIRRLMDPKPGVLPVRRHSLRPPAAWDEALASTLEAQVARAARPARGAVPPGAEAVLFADPAELLACLASDVARGSALAHWWWRGLFPSVDLARTVVAEWLRQPEYVPAALETTVLRREARPVLALFTEEEAHTLLAQVARVHGLPALASARQAAEGAATGSKAEALDAGGSGPVMAEVEASALAAPWEPRVPEVRTLGLGRARQALLGVALMLRRAPVEARSPSFAPAVVAWRAGPAEARREERARARVASPASALETGSTPMDVRGAGGSMGAASEVSPARGEKLEVRASPHRGNVAPNVSGGPSEEAGSGAPPPIEAVVARSSPVPSLVDAPAPANDGAADTVRGTAPDEGTPAVSPPSPAMPDSPPRVFEPPPGRAWGLPISTGLGGLFYLVNLGLFLELYGDFSRPMHPHLPLPLWDFVTLLGRGLLVDPRPSDPVWKVLALLSGRKPGEAPGQGFEPPDAWRVPEEWLLAFRTPEASEWTWAVGEDRLRIRHPAGFLVLDVPCESDSEAEVQVRRETEPYARALVPDPRKSARSDITRDATASPFTLARGEVTAPAGPEASLLERWLGWLVPYCRARLVRALGLPPDDALALEATLLTHEARLHVTETHVDVVLALSQLPLEVRVAGLDRDVGWLPSAGRHLSFHFE